MRLVYRHFGKMVRMTIRFSSIDSMRQWLQALACVIQLYPDPLPGSTHRKWLIDIFQARRSRVIDQLIQGWPFLVQETAPRSPVSRAVTRVTLSLFCRWVTEIALARWRRLNFL